MLHAPQRYAEYLQRELGGAGLRARSLVIAPTGFGVSGRELRSGRLRRAARRALGTPPGLHVSPAADGTRSPAPRPPPSAGSRAAAGRPLPAHVAPASYVATIPSRDDGLGIWLPIVLGVSSFALAWLGYELWRGSAAASRDGLALGYRCDAKLLERRVGRRSPAARPERDQAVGRPCREPAR